MFEPRVADPDEDPIIQKIPEPNNVQTRIVGPVHDPNFQKYKIQTQITFEPMVAHPDKDPIF